MRMGEAATQSVQSFNNPDGPAGAWDSVAGEFSTPMQHHGWLRACVEAFAPHLELHVEVIEQAGRPVAGAVLVRGRSLPERLELPGVNELYEPMDFPAADRTAVSLLAERLLELGSPMFLKRVPAESPTVTAILSACRGRGMVICHPVAGYSWILLGSSWLQPEHHLSAGRRSDFRRAWRVAERTGPVTSEIVAPTPPDLAPLLEAAYQVEARSWKGRRGSALAQNGAQRTFYSRYAAYAAGRGILRMCFLRIGGRVAAMQMAVECARRFWLLKVGYDEEFARCSPGVLLVRETVRYAAARGLSSYEFLGTVEPWTRLWTPSVRPCVSLRFYPARMKGVAALGADAAKIARDRLRGLVPGLT